MPRAMKCRDCPATIVLLGDPRSGRLRAFAPRPVDGRTHQGPPAYPVESRRAHLFPALVEDLMGRRGVPQTEAEQEAYDMPWHVPHDCPNRPSRADENEAHT